VGVDQARVDRAPAGTAVGALKDAATGRGVQRARGVRVDGQSGDAEGIAARVGQAGVDHAPAGTAIGALVGGFSARRRFVKRGPDIERAGSVRIYGERVEPPIIHRTLHRGAEGVAVVG